MKEVINMELQELLERIHSADDYEITQIVSAVTARYAQRYPDYETMFLTLPKTNPEERRNIVETALRTLEA